MANAKKDNKGHNTHKCFFANMPPEERTKPLRADPPESLHADFKKLAVDYDTNMKARLLALMQQDVFNWKNGVDTLTESKNSSQMAQDCELALACWKALLENRVPSEPDLIRLCAIFDADAAELREMLRKAIGGKRINGV